jgi:hypothetical protein
MLNVSKFLNDMSKTKTITYDPNWQETYKSQILTAPEAVKKIRPGQRVFIGTGTGEPLELVTALSKRATELPDTEIVHLLTFGDAPYAHRELAQYFRVNSFFIAENVRHSAPVRQRPVAARRGPHSRHAAGRAWHVQLRRVGGHHPQRRRERRARHRAGEPEHAAHTGRLFHPRA